MPVLRDYCTLKSETLTISAVLAKFSAVFPLGDRSKTPAELESIAEIYLDVLSDTHPEALWKAMEAFAREPDARFFPKPGELKARAARQEVEGFRLYSRAKALLSGRG